MSDHRVVITGGAGCIGSHLADSLAPANTITVLDDLSTGDRAHVPADVSLVDGDVRVASPVEETVEGADLIVHQAAEISVQRSIDQPRRSNAVNVDGTVNVLEAARTADARVVLASSCAIYGHPTSVPIAESHPIAPTSPYGVQKAAADRYARVYHDLYGLATVVLRYFNVYGPRQQGGDYSGVISVFLEQARAGDPITVDGDGTQTRDFVHVDDIVDANLAAATTDAVGAAYNIGTGRETSIRDLAEIIRDVMDSDSDIVHRDPREGDIQRSCAEYTRAAGALGYDPSVALEYGLGSVC